MREQTRFQDLLGRLLDDVCSPAERDELADLCRDSEALTKQLREALEMWEDDDDCCFDHHGCCQTHGGEPCRMQSLKSALKGTK